MSAAKKESIQEEQSLESRIMREPWFKRLNELQSRWISNTEENKSAYESQMSEAMIYVYMGCMQTANAKYDEFVCTEAMLWVMTDLKNYNPDLLPLGKYVSYHISSRMKEAYSRIKARNSVATEPSQSGPWEDALNELEKQFHEKDRTQWSEEVHLVTYAEHWKRFERFAPERKKQTLAAVKSVIGQYGPGKQSLVDFMEQILPERVCRLLDVPYTGKADKPKATVGTAVVLVPTHREEEEEENFADLIPDPAVDVEEMMEQQEAAQTVILALVLNFTALKNSRRDNAVRHYRMFYTEQLTGSARIVPLPQRWGKDILEALHHPYFRYFMADVEDDQKITLQTICRARPKKHGQVILDKSMDEYLPWDSELFLPAKVQIRYLQEKEQVSVSAATISSRKQEYRKSLLNLRENQKE